ncbi:uncharacterized protein CDV56_109393 [Aspergillus thermomutatus]|uniref:Uncharacterized protein n=1 Tax=Aspergillus thermomutatus TaxID=41047 RepID=A0A397HU84_ASPTH|nr:uncharacterized protein CDV56_109393 [Aspergillus thermomutatus]RHZ66779.1 hypothetical protein CDV56_109393 [Aspergillus thermomutatus]
MGARNDNKKAATPTMAEIKAILDSAAAEADASLIRPLTAIVLLFLFLHALYRAYLHPLRKIPGPGLARFTELWRSSRYFKGKWHRDILQLHRKYGPVVRIAPNEVSIVSPNLITTVYSYTGGTAKTSWYDTWAALGGAKSASTAPSFFGTTDTEQHRFLRKRVSATYSMSAVVSMEPKVQIVLDSLWAKFDEFAKFNQPLNLSIWASYFTYDVVGTLCLSEPMGFIQNGHDKHEFISCIHGAFYWIANLGNIPWQSGWIANPVTAVIAPRLGLRIADYARAFQRFSIDKILRRMEDKSGGQHDMLDHFLNMKGPQGQPAALGEILAEVGNLLAAGADTTSAAIKAVLGPILKDPVRYKRLQREIDAACEACDISPGSGKVLTYSNVKDLPFLTACVKEGSRIHPSIVYQLPRLAPAEGLNIEGYYISPSATVSMSPLAQNRCWAIFGDDADEWRPERWIEGEGNSLEKIKEMDKQLATFGYGSRTCVGRNLATFEVYKFVAQLLSRYDVELVNAKAEWDIRSWWFAEIDNCFIRIKARGVSQNQDAYTHSAGNSEDTLWSPVYKSSFRSDSGAFADFILISVPYAMEQKQYVFKRDGEVSIEADVFFPAAKPPSKLPIALYFHGGNFTVGSKELLPQFYKDRLIELGFIVVSANYRLCPTISVYNGPVKDCLDAYEWVRLELPGLLKEEGVAADGSRIGVFGHSCGATLALPTASLPNPPRAILDLFGMKYFEDPSYHTPSTTKSPPFDEEFLETIHKDIPPPTSGPPPMGPNGPDFTNYRVAWMFNAIKSGTHLKAVVADGDYARIDPASLFARIKSFPPTYFIHGTADTLVPARFSETAYRDLKSRGVETELVLIEGGGHGLDARVQPGDSIAGVVEKALQFLRAHVYD